MGGSVCRRVRNFLTAFLNSFSLSTFSSNLDINAGMEVDGQVRLNSNLSVSGISTFNGAIDANNNLTVAEFLTGVIIVTGAVNLN